MSDSNFGANILPLEALENLVDGTNSQDVVNASEQDSRPNKNLEADSANKHTNNNSKSSENQNVESESLNSSLSISKLCSENLYVSSANTTSPESSHSSQQQPTNTVNMLPSLPGCVTITNVSCAKTIPDEAKDGSQSDSKTESMETDDVLNHGKALHNVEELLKAERRSRSNSQGSNHSSSGSIHSDRRNSARSRSNSIEISTSNETSSSLTLSYKLSSSVSIQSNTQQQKTSQQNDAESFNHRLLNSSITIKPIHQSFAAATDNGSEVSSIEIKEKMDSQDSNSLFEDRESSSFNSALESLMTRNTSKNSSDIFESKTKNLQDTTSEVKKSSNSDLPPLEPSKLSLSISSILAGTNSSSVCSQSSTKNTVTKDQASSINSESSRVDSCIQNFENSKNKEDSDSDSISKSLCHDSSSLEFNETSTTKSFIAADTSVSRRQQPSPDTQNSNGESVHENLKLSQNPTSLESNSSEGVLSQIQENDPQQSQMDYQSCDLPEESREESDSSGQSGEGGVSGGTGTSLEEESFCWETVTCIFCESLVADEEPKLLPCLHSACNKCLTREASESVKNKDQEVVESKLY